MPNSVSVVKRKLMAKEEEKYEENNMNFESDYLSDHWSDLAQIWNRRSPTPRIFL